MVLIKSLLTVQIYSKHRDVVLFFLFMKLFLNAEQINIQEKHVIDEKKHEKQNM